MSRPSALTVLKQDLPFLALMLLLAAGLRLDFLIAGHFVIDADEAIVGLMAKHILEGKGIPTFYYGQHYMGSFEALLVSLVFAAIGISNAALQSVPFFFSLVFVVLVYLIGYRLGSVLTARVAAVLAALPPCALVVWSTKARGGFIEIVCIGALSLLLTLGWLDRFFHISRDLRLGRIALIGAVLGFGWWVNNQIIFFILPIGFVFLSTLLSGREQLGLPRALLRTALSGLIGGVAFLAGGLPFWIYNLNHDFASFEMFHSAKSAVLGEHVIGLFQIALPIIFGAKRFWQGQDAFPASTIFAYLLYGIPILVIFWGRRRQLLKLFTFRTHQIPALELMLLFVVSTLAVFAGSSFGFLVQAPRYLLPLYSALFPLAAVFIVIAFGVRRSMGYLWLSAILVLHLLSSYYGGRAIPGEPYVYQGQRVSRDQQELVKWLLDNKVEWVKTNYWIGYRLAFETGEKVRFLLFQKPYQDRIPEYRKEGEFTDEREVPFVLVPAQAELVEQGLSLLGYTFTRTDLSGYRVISNLTPKFDSLKPYPCSEITLEASSNPEAASRACDNDPETRWGSAHPQNDSMAFSVKLTQPRILRGLEYQIGGWESDYPRDLEIEAELADGSIKKLVTATEFHGMRYLTETEGSWFIHFDPIMVRKLRLHQLGTDPVFDWSIAEIKLLG